MESDDHSSKRSLAHAIERIAPSVVFTAYPPRIRASCLYPWSTDDKSIYKLLGPLSIIIVRNCSYFMLVHPTNPVQVSSWRNIAKFSVFKVCGAVVWSVGAVKEQDELSIVLSIVNDT
jgi:hypothetical protein